MEERNALTFGEFTSTWMREYGSVHLKPTGYREYESLLRLHLLPTFGDVALASISPLDVQAYLADRVRSGLSPRTVNNHLQLLRSLFKTAVSWRLVLSNPAAEVAALRQPRPERSWLTTDEMRLLIEATAPSWRLLIACACLLGARKGELLALRWIDVSVEDLTVTFRRSMRRGVVYDVKTLASRGMVPMPAGLVPLFEQRAMVSRGHELVFCRSDGSPLGDAIPNRVCAASLATAGLPHVRFHDLRRSWAIAHLQLGTPLHLIVELGRWRTAKTLLDEYAEFIPAAGAEAVGSLDRLLNVSRKSEDEDRG